MIRLTEIPDNAILFDTKEDAFDFKEKQIKTNEFWAVTKITKAAFPILEKDMYMVQEIHVNPWDKDRITTILGKASYSKQFLRASYYKKCTCSEIEQLCLLALDGLKWRELQALNFPIEVTLKNITEDKEIS